MKRFGIIRSFLLPLFFAALGGCGGSTTALTPTGGSVPKSAAVMPSAKKFALKYLQAPEAQGYTLVADSQNLWYPSDFDGKAYAWTISEYSAAGHETYDVPPPCSHCNAPQNLNVTYGPDNRVWFGECCEPYFGTMDSGGATQYYPAGHACTKDQCDIVVGAAVQGNVWFSAISGYRSTASLRVGYVSTTSGKVKSFSVPGSAFSEEAGEIVLGPDNNFWFAAGASIGRVTPQGKVTLFSAGNQYATEIVAGPDGDLWYSTPNSTYVSRMDTSGTILSTFYFQDGYVRQLALGPDQHVWLTQTLALVRMMSATTYQSYPIKQKGTFCQAHGVGLGPDGKLWFSQSGYETSGTCQYGLGIVVPKK